MRFTCAVLSTLITWTILPAAEPPAKGDPGPRIERLVKQLGSKSFAERERAEKELIAIGAAALPRLQKAAEDKDLEIAYWADQCIKEIKLNEKVAALVTDLKNPDPKVRWKAADTLMNMRSLAKPAVPALIEALDDKDKSVGLQVLGALEMVGPEAKAAIPRLTQLLNDQRADRWVRWKAAIVLKYIGSAAESAVPELLRMLEDKDPGMRNGAAQALGVLGRHHKDVVPALLRALDTKDASALDGAAVALGQLGKDRERCVPALVRALTLAGSDWSKDNDPRRGLMAGLRLFRPVSKSAIPVLTEVAADQQAHLSVRFAAVETLEEIGPDAKEALQKLQKLKGAEGGLVAQSAADAFKRIEAAVAQRKNQSFGR